MSIVELLVLLFGIPLLTASLNQLFDYVRIRIQERKALQALEDYFKGYSKLDEQSISYVKFGGSGSTDDKKLN